MRNLICLIFVFICNTFVMPAQTIYGHVTERETGHAISGLYVFEELTHQVVETDKNGNFSVPVQEGAGLRLKLSHVGYNERTLFLSGVRQDTTIEITVGLKVRELQDVNVKASRIRQVLTKSYSQTNIDDHIINEKIAGSLIDVLEEVPGITKSGEYISSIVLRGLGGKRLLICKDGNRRMGNFPSGFMGQSVNIYDLEKVEVIKGPASVKYGPGAITGIINLISKSAFRKQGVQGRGVVSYGTGNSEKMALGGVSRAGKNSALSFSGRFRDAGNYTYGGGKEAGNSDYRDKDLKLTYSWKNNESLLLKVESELHYGGPWGRPLGFNGTKYMRVYNPEDNNWHTSVTAKWQPPGKKTSAELSFYYDTEKRRQVKDSYDIGSGLLSYREDIRYKNYYAGWRGLALIDIGKNTCLNVGTDGVHFRIESPTELTDYFLITTINNKVSKDAGVSLAGLFVEAESKVPEKRLKLRAGLRFDYSRIEEGSVYDTLATSGRISNLSSWSGTAGAVYKTSKDIFLSLQIGRSCRMPDAREMFITSSNTDGYIYGNPDLNPEYGLNLDAGLRGFAGIFHFDLSLFSNFLNDFISLEYWTNSGKKGINYTYQNIHQARIIGAELSVGAQWEKLWHPNNKFVYHSAYVYTRGDDLTDEPDWFSSGDPLRNIPPFNLTQKLTLYRKISSASSIYTGAEMLYYTTQDRIAPSSEGGYVSPSYCLFGASGGYTFQKNSLKWDLKLKANNLADNKYCPFESLVYGMGRNFKIMLSVSF
jgi:outer membrane receptor protein involved in Fe transport